MTNPSAQTMTGEEAWHELIEKDDRNSPEEYPDHALITEAELTDFMSRAASAPAAVREAIFTNEAIAIRMRQTYEVTGDKWFKLAADALALPEEASTARDGRCSFPDCACINAPPCPHYAHTPPTTKPEEASTAAGEAVAWQYRERGNGQWYFVIDAERAKADGYEIRALYAAPPAAQTDGVREAITEACSIMERHGYLPQANNLRKLFP